jgi:hypothetical protein
MATRTENCKEIAQRREVVAQIINKHNEEGLWDTMKAKDVPEEVVQYVMSQIDLGVDPSQVRRELGIKSQTSKDWQKISAAIKMGYRVNATTYFHRLMGRNERIATGLYKILDHVLEQDVETLKETDNEGKPWLKTYSKDITQMVDALNRLQQGTVKLGKDLGVFADNSDGKSNTGTTIIVQSNIVIPKGKPVGSREKVIEGEVVGQKRLPK